jgi:hypothetical protein
MGTWTKAQIMQYTMLLTATAVQRGNARVILAGLMKSLRVGGKVNHGTRMSDGSRQSSDTVTETNSVTSKE